MSKNGAKQGVNSRTARKILISQPKPESERSPYFDLERKYNVELVFHPFIVLEGIPAREFRKQKIDVQQYTAIIFTSRNAIDHFFRMSEEMKLSIAQDTKYFCITEAVALYLQKFILYRKRKVFYGADGTNKSMLDVINKHKEAEKFSCSLRFLFCMRVSYWARYSRYRLANYFEYVKVFWRGVIIQYIWQISDLKRGSTTDAST